LSFAIPNRNDENVTSTPPGPLIEYASPGAQRPRRWLELLSLILAAIQFPCAGFAAFAAWAFIWGDNPIPPGAEGVYFFFAFIPAWLAIGLGARAFFRNRTNADMVLGFIGMIGGLIWLIFFVLEMVRS
jgi:hypothetical protein